MAVALPTSFPSCPIPPAAISQYEQKMSLPSPAGLWPSLCLENSCHFSLLVINPDLYPNCY